MTILQEMRRKRDWKRKHDRYRYWELYCKNKDTPEAIRTLQDKYKISRTLAYQLHNEFLVYGEPKL